MSTRDPDAGPRITCVVTGRTWPRTWASALRTCLACGGIIDTRTHAWRDGPTHAPCPTRPPAPAAPPPVRVKASTGPGPTPPDDTHARIMGELQAAQGGQGGVT